jgi:hypothetical protein
MMGRAKEAANALARLPQAAQSKPEIIRRRAVLAQKLGDRKALLAYMREQAAVEPNADNLATLADAQIAAGEVNAAAVTPEALLANRSLPAEDRARHSESPGISKRRAETPRAVVCSYNPTSSLSRAPTRLAQAAESAMQAKDWEQAARLYRRQSAMNESRGSPAPIMPLGWGSSASLSRDEEALAS